MLSMKRIQPLPVFLSLTQLYRYTPEIFLFSTATFKYKYRAPLRGIGQEYSAKVAFSIFQSIIWFSISTPWTALYVVANMWTIKQKVIKPNNSAAPSRGNIHSLLLKQIWFMTSGKIGDLCITFKFKYIWIDFLMSYILKKHMIHIHVQSCKQVWRDVVNAVIIFSVNNLICHFYSVNGTLCRRQHVND
jgi:hypothetical protein